MTQRRKSSRGASRQRPAPAPAGGAFLRAYGLGLVSGLFVAFLVYLATLPPDAVKEETAGPVPAPSRSVPRPEYEFYELLPQQEIPVEVDPADLPRPRAESEGPRFLLQAGSFRQADDADRRRAELLLLGLEPRVEETQGETGRWYRVILGPFESRSAMARARSLTAQQDIGTMLMQRKAG